MLMDMDSQHKGTFKGGSEVKNVRKNRYANTLPSELLPVTPSESTLWKSNCDSLFTDGTEHFSPHFVESVPSHKS